MCVARWHWTAVSTSQTGVSPYVSESESDSGAHHGWKFRCGFEVISRKVIDNDNTAFKVAESAPLTDRYPTERERKEHQKPIESDLQIVAICYEGAYWTKLRIYSGRVLFGLAIVIGIVGWLATSVGYLLTGITIIGSGLILICLSAIMTEPC